MSYFLFVYIACDPVNVRSSDSLHISDAARPNFTKFPVHVCGRGSVLL